MSSQYLQVDGASIYYEIEGNGPYIVFVAGGNGSGKLYKPVRSQLTKHFTVVLYDRRGYSGSKLTGPQDNAIHIDTDVEDLYRLMKHITNEKFIIFGICSSGIVLLKYLTTYPDTISKCFMFEPFTFYFHARSEIEKLKEYHNNVYNIFKKDGTHSATELYAKEYLNDFEGSIVIGGSAERKDEDIKRNWEYYFTHEWIQYPFAEIEELDKVSALKDKFELVSGIDSNSNSVKPVTNLSHYLKKEILVMPGGHISFFTDPKTFSELFIETCKIHNLL